MKKISLFLDKTLRSRLAENRTYSVAHRAALRLFGELVMFGTDRMGGRVSSDCYSDFGKYTCGCHEESVSVRELFRDANRVEACITLRGGPGLSLEVRGYQSGEKEYFRHFDFEFHLDGRPAISTSGGRGSLPSAAGPETCLPIYATADKDEARQHIEREFGSVQTCGNTECDVFAPPNGSIVEVTETVTDCYPEGANILEPGRWKLVVGMSCHKFHLVSVQRLKDEGDTGPNFPSMSIKAGFPFGVLVDWRAVRKVN
ncbi:MAG TPA: hypothetical protein VI953_02430 [Candidatus Paceibacterota bacterium]